MKKRRREISRRDECDRRDERQGHVHVERGRRDDHFRHEERCRRDERCRREERCRRDERAGLRERSRSRERGGRTGKYPAWRGHDGHLGQCRASCSDERGAEGRRTYGSMRRVPPPPPPRRPDGCGMPRMSATHGRAASAGGLRPNATALDSRALTREMGRASTLPELLSLEQTHGDRFDHFNIAAFWSKFKKLRCGELGGLRDCLAPVCERTVRMLPELDERKVSNVAHAVVGLVGSGPWESVWRTLPDVALRLLDGFDPQGLSNTAWAFAKAGRASAELFDAISAKVVRRRLGGFNEQALSNTAWAFATVGHASPELFHAISAEAVRRRLGGFNEQHLSNTAWAFATAGHASPELFKAISAEAVRRRLDNFNPQGLSNMAWAFATAGHASQELFKVISAVAVRRQLDNFNSQALSNTAWAFATAGHASPELFRVIPAEAARRRLGGFNPQQLSNMAWAFAVFDFPSADELFGTLSFTTRCAHFEASFSHKELYQLHQWSLWREERGGRSTLWPGLSESFRQACRDAFVKREARPSQLQSDVVREIRSRRFKVEEEHRCEISGYSIDAHVTLKGGDRIAVEVDGPSHFVGRSHQPTGATMLKHRQLRHFGWRLEIVPHWEWERSKELLWCC